jgi:hypothetical protein
MAKVYQYPERNTGKWHVQPKHEIGDIWKDGYVWKIQFPKGIFTSKTKKGAENASAIAKRAPKGGN